MVSLKPQIKVEQKMSNETTQARLDRIEGKLDKMGEVLISIARFEEKMDAYNEYRTNSWERMNKFSEKLDGIEKKVDDNQYTVRVINKLFWVAIVAAAGAITTQMWMQENTMNKQDIERMARAWQEVTEKTKRCCKDCGDEFGKPTTDCKNDCNDPNGSHWETVDEAKMDPVNKMALK